MTTNVLITGTSSGIGAATALALDRAGMTVFATVRQAADGDALRRGASERLQVLTMDVTDQDSIARAVATVDAAVSSTGLHAVVNNAGQAVPGPLELLALDDLRMQLEVNVVGQIAVTQAALPLLRRAGGRVVFVGSIGGKAAVQFAGPYHASKFAMEAIADSWRQELAPEKVAVVLIEPGPLATPIWHKGAQRLEALLADPSPRVARYTDRLRSFQDSLRSAATQGGSPEQAAEVILKAITTDRPRSRYTVGAAAGLVGAFEPMVPAKVLDFIGRRSSA